VVEPSTPTRIDLGPSVPCSNGGSSPGGTTAVYGPHAAWTYGSAAATPAAARTHQPGDQYRQHHTSKPWEHPPTGQLPGRALPLGPSCRRCCQRLTAVGCLQHRCNPTPNWPICVPEPLWFGAGRPRRVGVRPHI
jgi:hypothetical protein